MCAFGVLTDQRHLLIIMLTAKYTQTYMSKSVVAQCMQLTVKYTYSVTYIQIYTETNLVNL